MAHSSLLWIKIIALSFTVIIVDEVVKFVFRLFKKENKNDEVFSEKGSLQMDLINQWSEAEPMIKGLQKKESFSFQDADYKDENVLEVTFTISNLK